MKVLIHRGSPPLKAPSSRDFLYQWPKVSLMMKLLFHPEAIPYKIRHCPTNPGIEPIYWESLVRELIQQEISTRATLDGDTNATIGYFTGLRNENPGFFYELKTDEEGWLRRLFWMDLVSQLDCACFGDVLVFDSMYKTNLYNMPLVILAGVNHHLQNIKFACAFLDNETTEAYIWLLETFC
ncbi:hypothetical protein CRG98_027728 [Punica granatum]|uniref:MULE transposase domain-containing protein n=1 Tax=Punica granatum TaxID=22663 RepID=A0A2I0J6M0_PUNGR|nr:hypothetical protein CRG98_027728 [Punica granatum]